MKIEKIIYPFAVMVSAACLALSCNHLEVEAPSNLISLNIAGVSDAFSPETRSSEPLLQQRLSDDLWLTLTISDYPVLNDPFQTKGELTTTASFMSKYQTEGFGVYAEYTVDSSLVALNNALFIWDSSKSLWAPSPDVNWPSYATDWYCWAPRDIAFLFPDLKMIPYSTPVDNTANDIDILVAKRTQVPANYNDTLNITFKHALSAVRFCAPNGLPAGTIDSLTINNIYLDGIYNFDTNSWQDLSNMGSISLSLSPNLSVSPSNYTDLTQADQTFFVIPQQTVNLLTPPTFIIKHNGVNHTFEYPLRFEGGKLYDVEISYTPTVQPVDGQIHLDDPEDDGGTHNMYWK